MVFATCVLGIVWSKLCVFEMCRVGGECVLVVFSDQYRDISCSLLSAGMCNDVHDMDNRGDFRVCLHVLRLLLVDLFRVVELLGAASL